MNLDLFKDVNTQQLANTISNCKDKLKYGVNARNTSKTYTFDKIESKWLEHINDVMEAK